MSVVKYSSQWPWPATYLSCHQTANKVSTWLLLQSKFYYWHSVLGAIFSIVLQNFKQYYLVWNPESPSKQSFLLVRVEESPSPPLFSGSSVARWTGLTLTWTCKVGLNFFTSTEEKKCGCLLHNSQCFRKWQVYFSPDFYRNGIIIPIA